MRLDDKRRIATAVERSWIVAILAMFLMGVAPNYVPHHQVLVRNLRSAALFAKPQASSRRVARIPSGANLKLIYCGRRWCHVKYATITGFVRRGLLQYMPDYTPPGMRTGPHALRESHRNRP